MGQNDLQWQDRLGQSGLCRSDIERSKGSGPRRRNDLPRRGAAEPAGKGNGFQRAAPPDPGRDEDRGQGNLRKMGQNDLQRQDRLGESGFRRKGFDLSGISRGTGAASRRGSRSGAGNRRGSRDDPESAGEADGFQHAAPEDPGGNEGHGGRTLRQVGEDDL